ncbi:MAG: DUF3307 domain-containing protein [Bacteroidales bacterium]|nr:DUF3307 domain-containing protein [Bacteroidales bacterium]
MNLEQLLVLQLIAHLLTDYTFQSDILATDKNRLGFKSPFLKWHILIVFTLSWVLSFQPGFVLAAFTIAFFHFLADGLKVSLLESNTFRKYAFLIDQVVHMVTITFVVILFDRVIGIKPIFRFPMDIRLLAIAAAYLLCTKPANIIIKEVLYFFDIQIKKKEASTDDLPNAGKLIGITERWLVLTFILINQFEAVGFLIAAKSILRFKDDDTIKTEYVLIGTMLSFGISIACGLIIGLL